MYVCNFPAGCQLSWPAVARGGGGAVPDRGKEDTLHSHPSPPLIHIVTFLPPNPVSSSFLSTSEEMFGEDRVLQYLSPQAHAMAGRQRTQNCSLQRAALSRAARTPPHCPPAGSARDSPLGRVLTLPKADERRRKGSEQRCLPTQTTSSSWLVVLPTSPAAIPPGKSKSTTPEEKLLITQSPDIYSTLLRHERDTNHLLTPILENTLEIC